MKVYEGLNSEGELVYFEVPNVFLSRHAACKVVSHLPGASILSRPSWALFGREDVFCRFTLGDMHFELWEPFGDNSRFHISATPIGPSAPLQQLREAFEGYKPVLGIMRWLSLAAAAALGLHKFFLH
ncbi:hypothetical protein [Dyella humicola]|uniref:hypothetical protein n=1 Tax=Dyella humicola TaxID=2992126 RepID=UPI00224EA135|nr:hypothetical protein [Dyella humicola]